jgi:MFS family permease
MGFHFCRGHCGGITVILLTLGPGFGLTAVSPWSYNPTPAAFGTAAAIWLVVTQWLSSAFGGYLTGRLRTKWVGVRTGEVLFRDTAHGLLAWALATLIMATLVTLASIATAGVAAAAPDTAATAASATAEAAEQARKLGIAFAFTTSLSLLVGAFVAAAAGGLGGYHRDEA